MSKEGVSANTERVFRENETKANRMLTLILNVTILVVVLTWLLFESGFFYIRVHFRALMIFNIVIMGIASGISRYFKYEKKWIKYLLMGTLTLVYAGTTSALTYNVALLIAIPIIISIRYFSKRYTMFIAVLSIVVFFIAYLYGANHGMLDLNFVQYEPGTTIVANDKMWLDDAVRDIPYDGMLMIRNTMISNYFVKLMQYVIIAVSAVKLVGHCQDVMQKQKELTESSARIGAELDMASNIQNSMLPNLFPAFPERKEFEIYASMNPAKEVGGDFYDFFLIDDDHLCMVIADVSGKGVPAALFMMASKIILANNAKSGKSPAQILEDTNNTICSNNENNMFVTVWLGILEISTGKVIAANAGHEYPAIMSPDGTFSLFKDKHGLVVGGMEGAKYREYEVQLEPGSKIFVYTDGVPEATNHDEELFGVERMVRALNINSKDTAKELLGNMRHAVDGFVQNAPQFDDLTMLCLEYKGPVDK